MPTTRPTRTRHLTLVAGAVAASVALAACGGGGKDSRTADAPVQAMSVRDTVPDADHESASAEGLVTSLDDAQSAVIQIVAEGEFRDLSEGFGDRASFGTQFARSGSGFIIDPSGIAVTNSHVVAGAASLKVYIGGDDKEHNAKILGVDECSDLAVIDINGDGFSHVGWYDGDIEPGLEITAAGFPLGDPEFTMLRGIVTKAEADGETQWASVDHVIEHDANTQPGNSGGPLLTADAEVVGVHYASNSATNTSQFFAISADIAAPVVERLRDGIDGDTLGINAEALYDEETGTFGVWVAGVKSGSPAAEVGLQPGDIITQLEGQDVGVNGTMAEYCDVIRTQGADSPIGIEILRFDTQEVWEGEVNGQPLEWRFSFAQQLDDQTADTTEAYEFVPVVDETNTIRVEIPSTWTDISVAMSTAGEHQIPAIHASTSLAALDTTWDVPGLYFAYYPMLTSADTGYMLEATADFRGVSQGCTLDGVYTYDDGVFSGEYSVWTDCGGTSTQFVIVAASTAADDHMVLVQVQVVTDADLVALDHILDTFNLV